jgi:cytosine/creatinine deaminase
MIYDPLDELYKKIEKCGGFVNAHAHLDRAYSVTPDKMKSIVYKQLQEKWQLVDEYKKGSSTLDYERTILHAIEKQISMGTVACLSFIDIDLISGWRAINAANNVKGLLNGDFRFRIACQTLKGVLSSEMKSMVTSAVQSEFVDAIGSLPGADAGREAEHLDFLMELAKANNCPLHVHVDQLNTSEEKETELLARKTMQWGLEGRVVAVHGISIACHSKAYRQDLYKMCKDAGIYFVSCPVAWIDSRRTERLSPTHSAITPVDEMLEHGIKVAIGSDNIHDIYKPYATGNMKTELQFLLEATHIYDETELIKIATTNGHEILNL